MTVFEVVIVSGHIMVQVDDFMIQVSRGTSSSKTSTWWRRSVRTKAGFQLRPMRDGAWATVASCGTLWSACAKGKRRKAIWSWRLMLRSLFMRDTFRRKSWGGKFRRRDGRGGRGLLGQGRRGCAWYWRVRKKPRQKAKIKRQKAKGWSAARAFLGQTLGYRAFELSEDRVFKTTNGGQFGEFQPASGSDKVRRILGDRLLKNRVMNRFRCGPYQLLPFRETRNGKTLLRMFHSNPVHVNPLH